MDKSHRLRSQFIFSGLLGCTALVYGCEDFGELNSDERNGGISVKDSQDSASSASDASDSDSPSNSASEPSQSSQPSEDDSASQSDASVDSKHGEHADCIHHKAWWKTHSRFAKGKNNNRPWPTDEDTELCDQSWYDIMWTPPSGGNPWYKLAYQWIAASLNVANGAMPTVEVEAAIAEAGLILEPCVLDKSSWKEIHGLEKLLHSFNQGHTDSTCDEGEDDTGEDTTTGEEETTGEEDTTGEDTGEIPPAPQ